MPGGAGVGAGWEERSKANADGGGSWLGGGLGPEGSWRGSEEKGDRRGACEWVRRHYSEVGK